MRIAGGLMGALGGLGLMYFGIHQIMGKLPFPLATAEAAKLGAGLCALVGCVGILLVSKSRKKPDDAAPATSTTKQNPDA